MENDDGKDEDEFRSEDNIADDVGNEELEGSKAKKQKTRGATTGITSTRIKGDREIEFDENNVPTGRWRKHFATELRVQARKIRITYQTWKKVPAGKKDTIWAHIKAKSDKARESQKHNKHPHYMGQAGYVGKAEQWLKEELAKELANNPDADPVALKEEVIKRLKNRAYKWIKAHTPSSSDPPPQTQEVIESIKKLTELEENGEFIPSRMDDVLTKALGTKEHPGRTRGVGSFVGNQAAFGKPAREKMYSAKEVDAIWEEKEKKHKLEMMRMINELAMINGWTLPENFLAEENSSQGSPLRQDHSSCHSADPFDPFDQLEKSVPFRLAVHDAHANILVVVAEGMVRPWKENTVVHQKPLDYDHVHLSIDRCLDPTAPLPAPWSGFKTVGDAEGSFAQWPKKWVLLTEHEESNDKLKKKNNSKETKESHNKGKQHENDNGNREKGRGSREIHWEEKEIWKKNEQQRYSGAK